jgi:hypothetical protein
MTDINDLKAKLSKLQLKAMADSLDTVLADAQSKNTGQEIIRTRSFISWTWSLLKREWM